MWKLIHFNGSSVTPKNDAVLNDLTINQSGIVKGCILTHVATNQVAISAGIIVIKGREIEVSAETILCALTSSGTLPGRIYVKLNLSDTVTPVQPKTVCASTLPTLVQDEEINYTNGVYEMELATYIAGTTSISALVTTAKTIDPVNKIMLNSMAEVMANTLPNRVVNALVAKEVINSLIQYKSYSLGIMQYGTSELYATIADIDLSQYEIVGTSLYTTAIDANSDNGQVFNDIGIMCYKTYAGLTQIKLRYTTSNTTVKVNAFAKVLYRKIV